MPFTNEILTADAVTAFGRIVYSKALLDIITNAAVIDMAVNNGGTGYVVGETFDIVGGTAVSGFVARGVVTAESGGVVTGVKYLSAGAYSTLPGVTGAATTNASAAGNDDLTVDLTTQAAQWTQDRSTYTDDLTDFEWLATSVKASNPPTVGMTTSNSGGNDSSQLLVASGFNGGASFDGQPDGSPISQMYLNLPQQNPELMVSVTERRINLLARDGNNVQYGILGLFIPLTNSEASYPFPGMVAAQSAGIRAMSAQYNQDGNGNNNAGVLNPGSYTTVFPSYRYRDNLSTGWKTIASTAVSVNIDATMWPYNQVSDNYSFTHAPQLAAQNTDPAGNTQRYGVFGDSNNSARGWFDRPGGGAEGVQGVSPLGTGNQMSMVVTAHIIESQTGEVQVVGIIDGYENVHGVGLTAFEEIESANGGSRYIVFPDTNGADLGQWVAMEII